jgi:hypothetical protein
VNKFTFKLTIQDYYEKVSASLVIDGKAYSMDIASRSGSNPYTYIFTTTLFLDQDIYTYHYEVSSVWKFLQTPDYTLVVDFQTPRKGGEIYIGNRKINAWNIVLSDEVLPNVSTVDFETDEYIAGTTILVKIFADKIRTFKMNITKISKTDKGYRVQAKSQTNLEKTVSYGITGAKSLDFVKSILQSPIVGDLPEYIYSQAGEDTIGNILNKVLIINNARGYERNGKYYFKTDQDAKLKLSKLDNLISWTESRDNIRNWVREYYVVSQYPSQKNSLTNYDAANWTGTVSNVTKTTYGLLAPDGSPYILKGNGTISRSVSFNLADFDRLHLDWSPPTNTTQLTITLLQDSSNYLTYTRSFSGDVVAGFTLLTSTPSGELVKTITFTNKYISEVIGKTSQTCSVKVVLKSGTNIKSETSWQTTNQFGVFKFVFPKVQCDTLELHFGSPYPIDTSYGVKCELLQITEYAPDFTGMQTLQNEVWKKVVEELNLYFANFADKTTAYKGDTIHFVGKLGPFPVPSLSADEQYQWIAELDVGFWTSQNGYYVISIPVTFTVQNGNAYATFDYYYTVPDERVDLDTKASFHAQMSKVKITVQSQQVWRNLPYNWSMQYPKWDSIDVPISQFTKTGNPVKIYTITLSATGDNFYSSLYLYASQPNPQYVEVKDEESIRLYGEHFEERKIDKWSSKDAALLFATNYIKIFRKPIFEYVKNITWETPIELGDAVDCDGDISYVYRIVYDVDMATKTIYVGTNTTDLLRRLQEIAKKIDNLEKVIL